MTEFQNKYVSLVKEIFDKIDCILSDTYNSIPDMKLDSNEYPQSGEYSQFIELLRDLSSRKKSIESYLDKIKERIAGEINTN